MNHSQEIRNKIGNSDPFADPFEKRKVKEQGRLKIFFGYAAGVGKTYGSDIWIRT